MIYGYARVSSKSQEDNTSLSNQIHLLIENGCTDNTIYHEVFTGTRFDRPEFIKLENQLKPGDTIVITKLDRFTRSTMLGIQKLKELVDKGIKINILNMGIVDLNNPMGKMMFTILSAFAEYERDCIYERTQEGKAIARKRDDYREGRKPTYTKFTIDNALSMLNTNGGDYSYTKVSQLTGISVSTLTRAVRAQKLKKGGE